MRVDDYSEQEIEQDVNEVDWDFAYGEILKLEERKKDKYTMEADKKLQEEKARIQEEIYNEKVQDLIVLPQNRPLGGLKVREHK